MPWQKGHKKIGGIAKGTKWVKNQQWESLGEFLTTNGAERFLTMLQTMPDEEYTATFLQILEYFKPKRQRVDETVTIDDKRVSIDD